jgi:hypothetical protein
MRRPQSAVNRSDRDLSVPMLDGDRARRIAALEFEVGRLRLEVAQLREGLQTRQQIGVATGILAQRFGCSPDRAWSVLVRISQAMNVKVRDITRVLLDAKAGDVRAEDADLLAQLSEHLLMAWPEGREQSAQK